MNADGQISEWISLGTNLCEREIGYYISFPIIQPGRFIVGKVEHPIVSKCIDGDPL